MLGRHDVLHFCPCCTATPLCKLLFLLPHTNKLFAGLNHVLAENKYFSEFFGRTSQKLREGKFCEETKRALARQVLVLKVRSSLFSQGDALVEVSSNYPHVSKIVGYSSILTCSMGRHNFWLDHHVSVSTLQYLKNSKRSNSTASKNDIKRKFAWFHLISVIFEAFGRASSSEVEIYRDMKGSYLFFVSFLS